MANEIRDLIPRSLIALTPSASAQPAGIVGLRIENRDTAWQSFRVRMVHGDTDVTIGVPPGITDETFEIDRLYNTAPIPSANLFFYGYLA
jgi:hypothetical protein